MANHAHWKGILAAHEQGDIMRPEITQYDLPRCVREAKTRIWLTQIGTEDVESGPVLVSKKDFRQAIEDVVEFKDHRENPVRLLTDPDEALKTGEALIERKRAEGLTWMIKVDPKKKASKKSR